MATGTEGIAKNVVTFGEVMLRLLAPGFERFRQADSFRAVYAGTEANVACSLSLLGLPSLHVTRFPENDLGLTALQTLKGYGVDTSAVLFGKERLGIFFNENGAMQRPSRIIYDRFDSAFAHIRPGMVNWDELMRNACWFHWSGITPAISSGAAAVCLEALQSAKKSGVTVSGDINYRTNLWQYGKSPRDIMPELIGLTHIVVGGRKDIENSLGIAATDLQESFSQAMKACPQVQQLAHTSRKSVSASHNRIKGTLFDGKSFFDSREYNLTHIVDRVGSGDAFMAGLIYAIILKKNPAAAIEFATAASAFKHSVDGDVNLATAGEIQTLADGDESGKLLR